jgi:hypothetical protein
MARTKLASDTLLRDQIRDTIHHKQTNICSSAQILAAVALLKDAILMVKLHCDNIDDSVMNLSPSWLPCESKT